MKRQYWIALAVGLCLILMSVVVVFASKLMGAGFGGRLGGFSAKESIQLGFSMIPRGEVVLILATIGITEGLIEAGVFSIIVLLVVLTTLVTPPILQKLFTDSIHPDELTDEC